MKRYLLVCALAVPMVFVACSDDSGGDDGGVTPDQMITDGSAKPDHATSDGSKTPDQGGQKDLPAPAPGLELSHSGKAIPNGGSYAVPNNSTTAGEVAIFSEQKDRMVITNTGTTKITLTAIEIKGSSADAQDEEWKICDYSSATHECKPYTLGDLAAGKTFDFYLTFFPVASGSRPADLTVKYTNADGAQTYTAKIDGKGRIGSNALPAKLLSHGTLAMHKLWGGYGNSQDEFPGTMVADATGNMYFAGTATGVYGSKTGSDRNIFIVKVKADKSLGFAKVYHSSAHDQISSIDYGNSLMGAADAMTTDSAGNIYVTGMAGNGTNKKVLLVMKIDPATGKALWTKYWTGDKTRLQYTDDALGFGIDVSGGLVFITGKGKSAVSTQGMPVIALGTDGSFKWSKLIVPRGKATYAHEAHAIRADGKGNLFVAGIDKGYGGGAFVAKLKGVDASGSTVALDWAMNVTGSPVGTNFNSMSLDAQGNAFLALDRRGASMFFTVLKVSADGKTVTGKTVPTSKSNTGGSWDNIFVVRVAGSSVYAGGSIQTSGWDTGKGDGVIAKFATSDLKPAYAALYYTGSGPNEVCAHSTHGIAVNGKDVYLMGQVYTGNLNHYRYWGYWYDYPLAPADYTAKTADVASTTLVSPMPNAALVSATTDPTNFKNDGAYDDISTTLGIEFQDAKDKNESTHGSQTDADIFLMKITEK